MTGEREFDLVVFGATGFTGRQVVAYLRTRAPAPLRWAIAGRRHDALRGLDAGVPIVLADSTDPVGLADVVSRARVVLNMAGPFRRLGDPIVAACIESGTHYCDISGETARIRDLIDVHHIAAKRAGVRIVCFGGASSAPVDLAVHLLQERLDGDLCRAVAVLRLRSGFFNGGTVASMSDAVTSGDAVRERDPFLLGPGGRAPRTGEVDPVGVRWDGTRHAWLAASPLGVSDTRAVRYRSALDGTDVEFQEYLAFDGRRGLAQAILLRAVFDSIPLILRFRAGRGLLRRLAPPGAGPSQRQVTAGRYRADVVGIDRGGRKATVRISCDGDPGNRVTVLCASEIALALAADESALPSASGVLTPSAAIGSGLVDGFRRAGMNISVTSEFSG